MTISITFPLKRLCSLFLFCILWHVQLIAQNKSTLELVICDSLSNKPLQNVFVHFHEINLMEETNKQGRIKLDLLPSKYTITINRYENMPMVLKFNLKQDTLIGILLTPGIRHYDISEIEVTGSYFNKSENINSGLERIKARTIKAFPSLLGEKDVIKTLSSLPGVTQGSEGSADVFVRGGTSDQNLFVVDGNTIYKPSHLMGFVSSISPGIIQEVDFYKGSFPVDFGGKLSSVIDIKTRDPLNDTLGVEAELSTLSGKLTFASPIVKNKAAILLSARATYYDKIIRPFVSDDEYSLAGFYELFGKVSHKISQNENLMIILFLDRDYYFQGSEVEAESDKNYLRWKNQFVSAKYTNRLKQSGIFSVSTGWTRYKMQINEESNTADSTLSYTKNFNSYIEDIYLKFEYEKKTDSQLQLLLGTDYTFHNILPAEVKSRYYNKSYNQTIVASNNFNEINLYASNIFSLSTKLKIQAGLRFNSLINKSSNWFSTEPRLGIQYLLKNKNSFKISYTRASQAIHLLTNPGLGMPIDIFIPFSDKYKPESSNQFSMSANLNKRFSENIYYFSAEAYVRHMKNIITYLPGTSSRNFTALASTTKELEEIVTSGRGYSYGLELLLDKPFGKLNGRIAYTLSCVRHQFDELNNGRKFYAQHHRPNNLFIVSTYNVNEKNSFTASFNYMSGARVTLPIHFYNQNYFGVAGEYSFEYPSNGLPFYSQSGINASKMLDTHSLSLSYLYKFRKKKWHGEWELSVYNIYNRKNPYYYYLDYKNERNYSTESTTGYETNTKPILVSISMFGVIPSLSFRMRF